MKCVWKDPAFVTVLLDELKKEHIQCEKFAKLPTWQKKMGIVKDWIDHRFVRWLSKNECKIITPSTVLLTRIKRGNRTKGE